MTRESHVLVEFHKGAEASKAADRIKRKVEEKLANRVGPVYRLGQPIEVKIVDVDPTASAGEVFQALRVAISETHLDAKAEKEALQITGIWASKTGTQITTTRILRSLLNTYGKLKIGWTLARVRER